MHRRRRGGRVPFTGQVQGSGTWGDAGMGSSGRQGPLAVAPSALSGLAGDGKEPKALLAGTQRSAVSSGRVLLHYGREK